MLMASESHIASSWAEAPPKPIRRFFACVFDVSVCLFAYLLLVLLLILIPNPLSVVVLNPVSLMHNDLDPLFFSIFYYLFFAGAFVSLRAFCVAKTRTTPGKWISGLRVETKSGTRLLFGQAVEREGRMFVLGMGAGFWPITLVTGIVAYIKLRRRGETSWDERLGVRTLYDPAYNAIAVIVALFAFIALWVVMIMIVIRLPEMM